MPRGGIYFFALVALALILSACRTAPPPPPPPADLITVGEDPVAVVDSVTLAPGEWIDYELAIPAGIRAAYDVVYLELANTQLGAVLELRNSLYWNVLASSATPSVFVRGAISGVPQPVPVPQASPRPEAAATDPAGITTTRVCSGPCVIFAARGATYYARVVNDGGTTITADVHLYGLDLQDDTEPQNDSRSTAPVLATEVFGAIELLGDHDYWLAADDLAVTLAANSGVDVEAVVTSAGGVVVAGPYRSGETFSVFAGESVRLRAVGNNTAGAAGVSSYYLSSAALPPGTPGRPPGFIEVSASTNSATAVHSRAYAAGESFEYRLSLPSSVRTAAVLYVELDQAAGLELRSGTGLSAIASSSSAASFRSGAGSFSTSDQLSAAGVTVAADCRGSCVIIKPGSSSYRVIVTNLGGSRTISLYAFGDDFMDEFEPQNDATVSAPVLTTSDQGAIETIGDTDFWQLAYDGTVAFDTATPGITLEAEIVDASGAPVPNSGGPYPGGSSLTVFGGEFVRVWARDANQAAVAARSMYFLDYTATYGGVANEP